MENLKSNRMCIYKYNLKGQGKKLNVFTLLNVGLVLYHYMSFLHVKTFTYRCIYSTSITSARERDQNDQN